jgi:hypothetical protein
VPVVPTADELLAGPDVPVGAVEVDPGTPLEAFPDGIALARTMSLPSRITQPVTVTCWSVCDRACGVVERSAGRC